MKLSRTAGGAARHVATDEASLEVDGAQGRAERQAVGLVTCMGTSRLGRVVVKFIVSLSYHFPTKACKKSRSNRDIKSFSWPITRSVVATNAANLASKSSADTPGVLVLLKHRAVDPSAADGRLRSALTLDVASKLVGLGEGGLLVEVIDAQASETDAALTGLLDGAVGRDVGDFGASHAVSSDRLGCAVVCVVVVMMVLCTWTAGRHSTLVARDDGPRVLEALEHRWVLGVERRASTERRGVHRADIIGNVADHAAISTRTRTAVCTAAAIHRSGNLVCVLVRHLVALRAAVRSLRPAELEQRHLEVVQGTLDESVTLLEMQQEVVPQRVLAQHLRVTEDDKTVLGTRKGDVETTRVRQETNALVFVATHTREDDEVLLTSLERIYRGDLDLFVVLLPESAALLHTLHDEAALTLVRRDDTDVLWLDAGLEEASDDLLNVLSLSPV
jgi:hypothetical protein